MELVTPRRQMVLDLESHLRAGPRSTDHARRLRTPRAFRPRRLPLLGRRLGILRSQPGPFAAPVRPLGLTGTLLYPLAFFFMSRAARETRIGSAPLQVAAVASLIKLVDLAMPWRTRSPS